MLLWTTALFLAVSCVGNNVWLDLQFLSDPVFEGEVLTLKCQGWMHTQLSQVTFYKDGKPLNCSKNHQVCFIETATVKNSGQYSCKGQKTYTTRWLTYTSEAIRVQVQELFLPPVLSAIPSPELGEDSPLTLRCQTKPHPQKSTWQLFFSFHKNGHILQERSLHPELSIPEVKERDSGLYWCKVALEGHRVQKQSPPLEIKVQAPVSRPLLTLQPRAAGLAVGDVVELLCKAERGSPPILYSFYLNGEILGNYSALHGEAAPLRFLLKSEQDAGNYTCEAENIISRASSRPVKLSMNGSQDMSTLISSNQLVAWLLACVLGLMVIAAGLLAYFRPWRKAGTLRSRNLPSAPGGEQCPLYANVHYQKDKGENVTYSLVHTKRKEALPQDNSIYTEMTHSRSNKHPAKY
ncbi:Fc receptor-like protein 6 isoform X1 [Marmota marmota marmota]|uniref:Fc receptor-like protein 6 isoform X1 n=1 Tax=Marmota marmota marmota TaxID=9994 RepID=UPI002093DED6|nr:Fc receptor-like protein 6 isoform X1 [Marmota marmota marmota]